MKKASMILLIVLLLFCLSLPLAHKAYSMAQISMQNNTNLWLNLYIDNNFGCGPVMPNGFCTSSVTAGSHLLDARKGEEVVTAKEAVNIGDGTSPTWTVIPDMLKVKTPPTTIEGTWTNCQGNCRGISYITIVQQNGAYIVNVPGPTIRDIAPGSYYGSSVQITEHRTYTFEDLVIFFPTAPKAAIADAVGRLISTNVFTLTGAQSLTFCGNAFYINWYEQTGHLANIQEIPCHFKATFMRQAEAQ